MFGRLKKKPTPYLPPQEPDKWHFYDNYGKPIEKPKKVDDDREETGCCFRRGK